MNEAREILLERMTSPEIRAALEEGMTTVVVACGAVEQHGPHLPLLVDAEHASRLAIEVARRLGDALVAPTIRVGCSEHHMAFAGTVSLRPSTLEAVYSDYCTSLARHGFRRICCFSAHGGNFRVLADMLPRLKTLVPHGCRVDAFTDLGGFIGVWRETVHRLRGLGERVAGHADIAESSVVLALYPELVRADRAEAGHPGPLDEALVNRLLDEGFHGVTPNGVLGDPTGMEVEIGERCIEAMADMLAAHFAP